MLKKTIDKEVKETKKMMNKMRILMKINKLQKGKM